MSRQPPAARPPGVPPETIARALVIRPRFLGDVCLTLPVLDHLRRHLPHAEIDYLVEAPYAPLLAGDARLARVVTAPRSASIARTLPLLAALRARRYDLVLDLFCNPRTAVWTAATAARVRVGYTGKGWRSRVYNRPVSPTATSAVHFHLESIAGLGWPVDWEMIPRLSWSEEASRRARARLEAAELAGTADFVVFHPGAAWPTRRWPAEHFIALARRLLEREPQLALGVLAGPGETGLARRILEGTRSPRARLLADVPLDELPPLLARSRAFVGGDTGPLHVSVASGTPTVGLFGRNRPDTFFPYPAERGYRAVYAGVWCSPCHLDECAHISCLWMLTPEMADAALRECLARGREEAPAAAVASAGRTA